MDTRLPRLRTTRNGSAERYENRLPAAPGIAPSSRTGYGKSRKAGMSCAGCGSESNERLRVGEPSLVAGLAFNVGYLYGESFT